MSRQPLPIGTWGRIHTRVEKVDEKGKPVTVRAQAKYRDHDGVTRPVSAFGKTKTAAESNLLKKLRDRAKTSTTGQLTAMHRVRQAIELWESKFDELVADGKRSPTSLETYRRAIKNHLLPALGEVRIGEASTPGVDRVISEIKKRAGAPTARTCRSIISGVMGLAVRYGAISINPVREVDRIEHDAKKLPRALSGDEVQQLRKQLATDERAVNADLPDLATFMLSTGVRIGEALAVLWSQIDLDAGKVQITHTIVRIKGEGLLRKATKSKAGQRELGLPNWALAALRARYAAGIRLDEPIFSDTLGGFRDPSNVRRSLRDALAPVGSTARRHRRLGPLVQHQPAHAPPRPTPTRRSRGRLLCTNPRRPTGRTHITEGASNPGRFTALQGSRTHKKPHSSSRSANGLFKTWCIRTTEYETAHYATLNREPQPV